MLPQQRQNPATAMKPATTMPLPATAPVKQRGTHPQIAENTHHLILHNPTPIHKEPNEIQDNRKQAAVKAPPVSTVRRKSAAGTRKTPPPENTGTTGHPS